MVDNMIDDQVLALRNASTDLAWDYSAHEASPLLRGTAAALQRSNRKLSVEQLSYLIDNLDEVGRVLKAQISPSTASTPNQPKCPIFRKFVFTIPFIFSILHITAVITDSVLNFQKCYFTYVATSINAILLLTFQVEKWIVSRPRIPPLLPLTISLTLLTLLFASLYTIAQTQNSSLSHWALYLHSIHSSISVTSLNYYGQIIQENYWIPILLNLQMLYSLIHLFLILVSLLRWTGRIGGHDDDDLSGGVDDDDADTGSYQASFGRVNR